MAPSIKTRAGYLKYNSKYQRTIIKRMEPSMKKIVQYIGIDVDDKAYHVCVYNPLNDEVKQFKCGPSTDLLIRGFKRHNLSPEEVTICYEASYILFSGM